MWLSVIEPRFARNEDKTKYGESGSAEPFSGGECNSSRARRRRFAITTISFSFGGVYLSAQRKEGLFCDKMELQPADIESFF